MTTLELSVGVIANFSYWSHDTWTTRMSALKGLFFVDTGGTFDLVRAEIVARRGHGGRATERWILVSSKYSFEKKREKLHYEFHVPRCRDEMKLYAWS
jgi:hypothetical protein